MNNTMNTHLPSMRCSSIAVRLVSAVAVMAGLSAAGWAQSTADTEALAPGARVRIAAPDIAPGRTIGNVTHIDAQSIAVTVPDSHEELTFPRAKIMALDVSAGPRSRGTDSLIGAGIGVAVGAIIGAAAHKSGNGVVNSGETAALGAVLGGGLGAVIGAVIPPGERWRPVAPSSDRFSLLPRIDHERGIAILFRF